jgi:hypothetical protein
MNLKLPPIAPVPVEQRRASFLNDIDNKLYWMTSKWEAHGKYRDLAQEWDNKFFKARVKNKKDRYAKKSKEFHDMADIFKLQAMRATEELRDIITQLSYETENFPSDQH